MNHPITPNRLITARDLARRDGFANVTGWMHWLAERSRTLGRFQVMWDGAHVAGAPLAAFVDFGRWLVRCECGQYNYVAPEEPVMFCARCGNANSGMARPVVFPSEAMQRTIQRVLLQRPILPHPMAKNEIEAARLAKPVHAYLPRSWHPSQSLEELIAMNSTILGGE
jgi:hypothetical protein